MVSAQNMQLYLAVYIVVLCGCICNTILHFRRSSTENIFFSSFTVNNKVFESENQYGLSSENLYMSALEKYTAEVFRTSQKEKKNEVSHSILS